MSTKVFESFLGQVTYREQTGVYATPEVKSHSSFMPLGGAEWDYDNREDLPDGDTRTVVNCGDARRAYRFAVQL